MADAVVSMAIERLAAIVEENIKDEIHLVRGVKKEIRYLSSELTTIRKVLEDAEMRGYKEKDNSIQMWLKKLEDLSYDVDDVLDEWNFTILKRKIEVSESKDVDDPQHKVCSCLPCSSLSFKKYVGHRDIAVEIKGLKERLEVIVKEKDRYGFMIGQAVQPERSGRVRSTSSVDVSEIQGREVEKDALVRKLIQDGSQEGGPTVISIVGTGGIGKTTLAQLAYNDPQVISSFELKIWICVSDVFDEVRIAKGITEAMTKSSPNLNELEALLKCLEDYISGKKFLLVLDDIWTEDYNKWEPFKKSLKCGGRGSKILLTTRSERVARMMGTTEIHHLGRLSDIDCWLLMRQIAFFGRREEDCEVLQAIGENIAKKCNGLPLAAKVLGSLLHFRDNSEEWEDVFCSELWKLEIVEVDLFPHLFLSYNELSPALKRCFSYCAIFPKDIQIDVEKLIKMWMAMGYLSSNSSGTVDLELRGKEYFDSLRMRSFFQNFDDRFGRAVCKMHDIVHDFAQFVRKTTNHIEEDTDPSLISQVKVYRSLFHHLNKVPPYLLDSTTCLRVLGTSVPVCFNFQTREVAEQILQYIERWIHLRYLDLSNYEIIGQLFQSICKLYNLQTLYLTLCRFNEIPREIGNLINLRHLNLCSTDIEELPETICNLHELRILDIGWCQRLYRLPEGIHKLTNLRHLRNEGTSTLRMIPQGFEQLTGLQTLKEFQSGRGQSKLAYLKKMDRLSGSLELIMNSVRSGNLVDAKKAELRNKKHLRHLTLVFLFDIYGSMELITNEFLEALQPPPYLQSLAIRGYYGTKFPGWITTSLNHLKGMDLMGFSKCSTLPPLEKLPCLEELSVSRMSAMESLDREFLGIAAASAGEIENGVIGVFPKLQKLTFESCSSWKEWEDITDEEAANDNLKIMPCLKELTIKECHELSALPHRLLRKASALDHLTIKCSFHLLEYYNDKDGSGWGSLSHIPHLTLNMEPW